MEEQYLLVSLKKLLPSETNPRKHNTNGQDIQDLADSIKSHGILQPILVRSKNGSGKSATAVKYEIISGGRRFRAASIAGLSYLPLLIRKLDHSAVIEGQIIENLQRKDVHPLDEAEGFNMLLERGTLTKESIAERVGKPLTYIYKRLQLVKLNPDLKKAFFENKFALAHGIEFARLTPSQQDQTFKWYKNQHHTYQTAGNLKDHIESSYHLNLKDAPFATIDEKLMDLLPDKHMYKSAGSCLACIKRTGFNKNLFDDIESTDICTDPGCYHAKVNANVQMLKKKYFDKTGKDLVEIKYSSRVNICLNTKGSPGVMDAKKKCADTKDAIYVDVPNWKTGIKIGQIIKICDNAKCKTHWKKSDREAASPAVKHDDPKEVEKRKKAQFEESIIDISYRRAAMAVGKKLKWPLDVDILDKLIEYCSDSGWGDEVFDNMFEDRGLEGYGLPELIDKKSNVEKLRLIGEFVLRYSGEKLINKMVKKYKVNLNKIKKEVRAELKEK